MSLIFAILTSLSALFGGDLPEDHLLFNCHTNGNHICGPGTPADGFVNIPLPR